jgi:hypothetical protein
MLQYPIFSRTKQGLNQMFWLPDTKPIHQYSSCGIQELGQPFTMIAECDVSRSTFIQRHHWFCSRFFKTLSACLLELISRIYQPFNNVFLSKNQPTGYQLNDMQPCSQESCLVVNH